MKPLSFDSETAREITGDDVSRTVEKKAREDADKGFYDPPKFSSGTYWDGVRGQMGEIVYLAQYQKRIARNERKRQA